jgi:glycosyltransferase involved in cell wall biosynthesis
LTTVDVVIPTFRETTRLFRAVESAKNQTHPVSKIWVVDDGSEDSVIREITKRFKGDDQVIFTSFPHSGIPGKLREWAITHSNSEWIAFLDADDYWLQQKISSQLHLAEQTDAEGIFSNATIVTDSDTHLYFPEDSFRDKVTFLDLLSENRLVNSSVLVRRLRLLDIGIYCSSSNVRGVEDYATWLRLSTKITFVGSPEPWTFYQVSAGGLSKENVSRIFAFADFLDWSRENTDKNLGEKAVSFIQRATVILRVATEFLRGAPARLVKRD